MSHVCFRCGIQENLVIQSDKKFICMDCLNVEHKRKKHEEK